MPLRDPALAKPIIIESRRSLHHGRAIKEPVQIEWPYCSQSYCHAAGWLKLKGAGDHKAFITVTALLQ